MSNFQNLKNEISRAIRENGNQEITGDLLQEKLLEMVDSLGKDYKFRGIATPDGEPITDDTNVFYVANTVGAYPNYGGLSVANGEIAFFTYNGSWSKVALEDVASKSDILTHDGVSHWTPNVANYYIDNSGAINDNVSFINTDIVEVKAGTYIEYTCSMPSGTQDIPVLLFSKDKTVWTPTYYADDTNFYTYLYVVQEDGYVALSGRIGREKTFFARHKDLYNVRITRQSVYVAHGIANGIIDQKSRVMIKNIPTTFDNVCINNVFSVEQVKLFGVVGGQLKIITNISPCEIFDNQVVIRKNIYTSYDYLFIVLHRTIDYTDDEMDLIQININRISDNNSAMVLSKTPNGYIDSDGELVISEKHHYEKYRVYEGDIIRLVGVVDGNLYPFLFSTDDVVYNALSPLAVGSDTLAEYQCGVPSTGFLIVNSNINNDTVVYFNRQPFYRKFEPNTATYIEGNPLIRFGYIYEKRRCLFKNVLIDDSSEIVLYNMNAVFVKYVVGFVNNNPIHSVSFTSKTETNGINVLTLTLPNDVEYVSIVLAKDDDSEFTLDDYKDISLEVRKKTSTGTSYTISDCVQAFMRVLNNKANQIGMSNSFFYNPYGGGVYGYNTSTVRDLLKLTIFAQGYDKLRELWSLSQADVEVLGSNSRITTVENAIYRQFEEYYQELHHEEIDNPYKILGCKAGGWTPESHRGYSLCAVVLIKPLNKIVACVTAETTSDGVVGRQNRVKAMIELLDICAAKLSNQDISNMSVSFGDMAIGCELPIYSNCYRNNEDIDIIYQLNADVSLNPASTSKILCTLTVLDIISNWEELYCMSDDSRELINDSDYAAQAGDVETVRSSLYASMLASNAANTLMLARVCGERILKEKDKYGLEL